MKTDQATNATPEAVCSTAMLGPLPEPDGEFYSWRGQYRVQSKAAYSAETVLRLLAAERERCAKIVHRMAVDPGMTDEQSAALFDAERALLA